MGRSIVVVNFFPNLKISKILKFLIWKNIYTIYRCEMQKKKKKKKKKNIVHAKWKIESLTWIILRVQSPWDHFSNFQRISLTLCLLVGLLHDSDDNSVEYHLCYSFMKGPSPPLWWTIPAMASTLKAQCYRMFNLRHFKRDHTYGNF